MTSGGKGSLGAWGILGALGPLGATGVLCGPGDPKRHWGPIIFWNRDTPGAWGSLGAQTPQTPVGLGSSAGLGTPMGKKLIEARRPQEARDI
jgi:hypothetical protein